MDKVLKAAVELVACIPQTVKLLTRLARDPRVPVRAKRVAAALAVYAVSPIDLSPDWLPVVGLVDDLLALVLAVTVLVESTPEEVVAEHWEGTPEMLERIRAGAGLVMDRLPARLRWVLRWMVGE